MSCLLEIGIRHEVQRSICRKMWKEIYDYERQCLEMELLFDRWTPPQLIALEKQAIFDKYNKWMEEV